MIPGMWAAVMKLFPVTDQPLIFPTSESHDNDLQLPILLTECTVVVRTFKCVSLTSPHKFYKPYSITFSSKTLLYNSVSSKAKLPFVEETSKATPQPNSESSVISVS